MVCPGPAGHVALADFVQQGIPVGVSEVLSNVLRHHVVRGIESVRAVVHDVMDEHEQSTGLHCLSEVQFYLMVADLGDGRVLGGHQIKIDKRRVKETLNQPSDLHSGGIRSGTCASHGNGGDVHARDGPSSLSKPHGIRALTAAHVQCGSGRER